MARLEGKIGIVTGAGSGIGQVTAALLPERGAVVIISNINGPAAESVTCGLKERGLFAVPTTTDIDADLLARVSRVDVSGALLGAKQGISQMLARSGGVIINTSAGAVLSGELVRPIYSTSEAAIIGMTRNIATQYGKQGDSFDGHDAIRHPHTRGSCDNSTPGASVGDTPHLAATRRTPGIHCQPRGLSCVH
jgi:NAD(P)-dependent dehydrogenase (short-subunit alcohol dehydrogenase family)